MMMLEMDVVLWFTQHDRYYQVLTPSSHRIPCSNLAGTVRDTGDSSTHS
jgi:hypothetical protein